MGPHASQEVDLGDGWRPAELAALALLPPAAHRSGTGNARLNGQSGVKATFVLEVGGGEVMSNES
jgi:hypothetical protein